MTPCRDALQVFSASLRKPAWRYGYRGLKIVTSLSLRFQDFQRQCFTNKPAELYMGKCLIASNASDCHALLNLLRIFANRVSGVMAIYGF
ncbi:hypothetical protein [Methylomonas albis]|nr:hypothetical protein [Methylomonas albis]